MDLSEFVDGEGQAANLKKYLGESVIDMGRTNGNELYGIVARRATTARSNFFVRKDWMDALGSVCRPRLTSCIIWLNR